MTDRYIDQEETHIYGPYAVKKIASVVKGLVPECDGALEHMAANVEKATTAVKGALKLARTAGAGVRKGAKERKPALAGAIDVLGRFSSHLDGHKKGAVDRKTYFTKDGTAAGVGRATADVLLALGHIHGELTKDGSPVKNSTDWAADFGAAIGALTPVADHADAARTDRRESTPEIEAARAAWLLVYGAAKLVVEAVLRLTGKLQLMSEVFHDLAVAGNAKVTAPPPETSGGRGAKGDGGEVGA
ncbi:MAG: hypothetical protein HY720_05970 [Planctomycetes bacterium]|nr:hypothetical protein [Planctomycetota bacterium]